MFRYWNQGSDWRTLHPASAAVMGQRCVKQNPKEDGPPTRKQKRIAKTSPTLSQKPRKDGPPRSSLRIGSQPCGQGPATRLANASALRTRFSSFVIHAFSVFRSVLV